MDTMLNRKIIMAAAFVVGALGAHPCARAQSDSSLDPASAFLIQNGGGAGRPNSAAMESGRYTVRPKNEAKAQPGQKRSKENSEENHDSTTHQGPSAEPTITPTPTPVPVSSSPPVAPASHQEVIVRCEQAPSPGTCPPPEPGRRINILELSFAPGYLYNNSDSSYHFRNYSTATPSFSLESQVWFGSAFALHGSYTGTLSGHVNDSTTGLRNSPVNQEWFMAGFRLRKSAGSDREPGSLTMGFDYYDYQFRVPTDATMRARLSSTGVQLSLDAEIPASGARSWLIGATLAPKLRHSEGATAVDFKSGGNVDSNAVGVSFGGRVQLNRSEAVFWKLSHTVEKDLFAGDATKPDPVTGASPTGVAVINSFSMIQVGYSWGN